MKHKTYVLRRDESHEKLLKLFQSIKVDKNILAMFDDIATEVFHDREKEKEKNSLSYETQLKSLESKEKEILNNIDKFMNFPTLLEKKNMDLENIKAEKTQLMIAKNSKSETINLDQFKYHAKDLITHINKLAFQKEKPKLIELAFALVFG